MEQTYQCLLVNFFNTSIIPKLPNDCKYCECEKRGVSGRLTYLQTYEPGAIRKNGRNEHYLIEHDSLKISNNKWHWFSRGFGGKTALDFLIHVRGMDFVDAVQTLCNGYAAPASSFQPVNHPPVPKPKAAGFTLPPKNRNNDRAIAYLLGRGIDKEIIGRCIEAATFYESKQYHNCAFVGHDGSGKPRFACVRGTTSGFRQDMEYSDKRYGFCLPADRPPGNVVMVAEAPIDALSLATLKKMETAEWNGYHYLALGGTSPLALIQYLTDHREIDHVTLCLDNDKAGREGAVKIMESVFTDETLTNRALTVNVEPPDTGNDFNDTLLAAIKEKKEQAKTSRPDRAAISI